MTDPIADMLTRIRNGSRARFKSVDVMPSRFNQNLAKVLKKAGYIARAELKKDGDGKQMLRIYLRYTDDKKSAITAITRISKPGRRVYVRSDEISAVLNGFGLAVISTSRGLLTDKEARELNVGGEIICNVW